MQRWPGYLVLLHCLIWFHSDQGCAYVEKAPCPLLCNECQGFREERVAGWIDVINPLWRWGLDWFSIRPDLIVPEWFEPKCSSCVRAGIFGRVWKVDALMCREIVAFWIIRMKKLLQTVDKNGLQELASKVE